MKAIIFSIAFVLLYNYSICQDKLSSTFLRKKINQYHRTFNLSFHSSEKINFIIYGQASMAEYHISFFDSIVYSFTDSVYLPKIFKKRFAFGIVEGPGNTFDIIVGQRFNKASIEMIPDMGYKLVLRYKINKSRIELLEVRFVNFE